MAPETAQNMRNYVQQYGKDGLTVPASEINSKDQADKMRDAGISEHRKEGHMIDECPPAMIRNPGAPCTVVAVDTSTEEGRLEAARKWLYTFHISRNANLYY